VRTNVDVLLLNGTISQIGVGLSAPYDVLIDGSNKYLTAGLVDLHRCRILGGACVVELPS
jgi:dihydroorotase-like cyclic amidohydrolase